MKKMNHKSILKASFVIALLCIICFAGCGKEEKLGLYPADNIAPAPPTNISVENINGGSIISFNAPKDDDLLCVVATYIINGEERTAKVSPYVNKLTVEGFGKEGEYKVFLKSVDKSNNESQPIEVKINPLTPPVQIIFESLKVVDSFGGVKVSWENLQENNIIVEVFRKDGDEWISVENFYSSTSVGMATIRGFDPEPIKFRTRIRDRWDNYSDFYETENLPLYEIMIDKSKFRTITPLPGDSPEHSSYPIRLLFDGNTGNFYHGGGNDIGRSITFDMGQVAKISRFKMYQRLGQFTYTHNNLKNYVIYGCNDISGMYDTSTNGVVINGLTYPTFDGWTKIVDVRCYKPSGDSGVITNEDNEYIAGGDEHEVPIEAPAFRYVRIHFIENWSGGTISQIAEMTFWGQTVE